MWLGRARYPRAQQPTILVSDWSNYFVYFFPSRLASSATSAVKLFVPVACSLKSVAYSPAIDWAASQAVLKAAWKL
jgi:hypothetical protein